MNHESARQGIPFLDSAKTRQTLERRVYTFDRPTYAGNAIATVLPLTGQECTITLRDQTTQREPEAVDLDFSKNGQHN
jgi:electron transfer flavoprotein alpha subunit